jgi:hypothetical protein
MGQIPNKRIVSDPEIMMGKSTIKGTRITGELILEELGDGRARSRRSVFAADDLRNENIAFGSPGAARQSRSHLPRCRRCLSL